MKKKQGTTSLRVTSSAGTELSVKIPDVDLKRLLVAAGVREIVPVAFIRSLVVFFGLEEK